MNLQIRIPSHDEFANWRHQHKQWFRTLIQASEYVVHLLGVGMNRPVHSRQWAMQTLAVLQDYEYLTTQLCRKLQSRRTEWCERLLKMDEHLFELVMTIRHYGSTIDDWKIQSYTDPTEEMEPPTYQW